MAGTINIGEIVRSVVREDTATPTKDRLDKLDEIEQQIQMEVTGSVGGTLASQSVDLVFDVEFIDATYQRYSNLVEPLFNYGAKLDSGLLLLQAVVTAYALDSRGIITGATVAILACNPGGSTTNFAGRVDLSWQGYGCVPNEPLDPDFD